MTKNNIISKEEKIKNILAFLVIIFGDQFDSHPYIMDRIMEIHPDYLIEKFERYILSLRDELDWVLHPLLRKTAFNKYCEKYKLSITS